MATIVGEQELRQFVQDNGIIQNGDVSCAEGLKYDFRLGTRFLKAGFNSPKSYDELNERDAAIVEPGEVVFVLTNERVEIPLDINVQLHEKRKLSHDGISLLGGRGIDPGYKGYLVFGIHNIAGSVFRLKPGRKLIGATFYRLSTEEIVTPTKFPEPLEDFPDDLLRLIEKYRPVNPVVINEKLNELQNRLDKDKDTLLLKIDGLDYKMVLLDSKVEDKFANFNDKIGAKIGHIDKKVNDVDDRTKNISETILALKVWAKVIAGILGIGAAIIAGVLTGFFARILGLE